MTITTALILLIVTIVGVVGVVGVGVALAGVIIPASNRRGPMREPPVLQRDRHHF